MNWTTTFSLRMFFILILLRKWLMNFLLYLEFHLTCFDRLKLQKEKWCKCYLNCIVIWNFSLQTSICLKWRSARQTSINVKLMKILSVSSPNEYWITMYIEASEPKWGSPMLNIIGINSLWLGGHHITILMSITPSILI